MKIVMMIFLILSATAFPLCSGFLDNLEGQSLIAKRVARQAAGERTQTRSAHRRSLFRREHTGKPRPRPMLLEVLQERSQRDTQTNNSMRAADEVGNLGHPLFPTSVNTRELIAPWLTHWIGGSRDKRSAQPPEAPEATSNILLAHSRRRMELSNEATSKPQRVDLSMSHTANANLISHIGGNALCHTSFVTSSFTPESILQAEKNLDSWIQNLSETTEDYNNKMIKQNKNPLTWRDEGGLHRFDIAFPPEGPPCREKISWFGSPDGPRKHDIQKSVCRADTSLFTHSNCNIVSIGSQSEWDEEIGFHAQTKCRIHTFDCTSDDKSMPAQIRDRTTFYKICLGDKNETDDHGRQFLDWPSLLRLANISETPDYLKMDIEGFEYQVLRSVIRGSQESEHENKLTAPNQIALEIHHETYRSGNPAASLSWSHRQKDVAELSGFMLGLYQFGYRMMFKDPDTVCGHCIEVLLARLYC